MIKNELGELENYRTTLPDAVKDHPSMMSAMECEILYGLTKELYTGEGKIVDAGVFLGASTRLFGHAIKANANSKAILEKFPQPVVTFEWAGLGGGMPAFFERNNVETEGLLTETSFAPLLEKMIKDVRPTTDLRLGDICAQTWDDTPIEICFLDVIKGDVINQFVFNLFMPRMIPGKSILIQQDYFIDRLPFLKVTQESLAPYFEYMGNVQSSGYFRLIKEIPPEVLAETINTKDVPIDKKLALIEQCADRVKFDEHRHYLVSLSKVLAYLQNRDIEGARAVFDELIAANPDFQGENAKYARRFGQSYSGIENDFKNTARALAKRKANRAARGLVD